MTLVDTATAAAALGVAPATIRSYVHRGRLTPAGRIGRANAYNLADIEALAPHPDQVCNTSRQVA